MKKILFPLLSLIAVSAIAHAGPAASPKQVISPAVPCLWNWFAGGSGGYVTGDWDEPIYTAHVGAEYDCGGCTHAFFLEVGYTEKDESIDHHYSDPCPDGDTWVESYKEDIIRLDIESEIIPITVNYKYECGLGGDWRWYVGAGAGIALVELEANDTGSSKSETWDDTVFYAHVFAGVIFRVSNSFELFGGVRYIIMDDPTLSGHSDLDEQATLDGGFMVEVGGRAKF